MKVFVTGGSGGIGKSIVDALKSSHVSVVAPSSKELDLSSDFDLKKYGDFDGFIHCAGVNSVTECGEVEEGELEKVFKINTFSFLKISSELSLNEGSNIVAVGSLYM